MKNAARFSAPSHFCMVPGNERSVAATATNQGQTELASPVNVLLAGEKRPPVETLRDLE
jgi:hypothetical protein